ncbi:MAG: glycosyltransferase family 39 protein [Candidatus Latescibacteria bacterium]|nr:glycosyltransferase family 39 protein [Candidatus Latescibacterota bacterium]
MPDRSTKTDFFILTGLSLLLLLYHMILSTLASYGYFIDELYYIACSKRLAFGYIDHPPLSILLLALNRWILGDSIPAIRFLPALGVAGTVFLTGLITRRFGGSRTAMIIAALAVIVMPIYLLMGSFYSMNAFEPAIWAAIIYCMIRLVQEENTKYWIVIGLLMGTGLEMKHTLMVYIAALLFGLLLTGNRRFLWNRWFIYGMLCCLLLLVPNLAWQYLHGFPSLEFYHNAMINKNIPTSPLHIVFDQMLFANPLAFPLWIAGLAFIFLSPDMKKYRFLGWAYLPLLAMMIASASSRPDRIAAMYTVLFAAGAVAIDRLRHPSIQRSAAILMIAMLIIGGILFTPITTPLLPPSVVKQYISALGLSFNLESGKKDEPVPQWLADRLGWYELASDVARVCQTLSEDEKRNSIIISTNYGEAGALELFGPGFHLPPVYATHNNYHLWGPPPDSIRTYIAVFVNRDDLDKMFDHVIEARIHTCKNCTRQQQQIPIYIARGPRFSVTTEWPKVKSYN